MKIKVSDLVANILVEHGIRHVFMLTGGGAMHLNNSLGKHKDLRCIFSHHEQTCATAAESYARYSNRMAAVNVTSGPGGTNAITGVLGAWLDSVPMLIISGQVRYDTTVASSGLNLRQLGDQEIEIVKSVSNMTKYAVMVTEANSIAYHLEKAIYLAKSGRPGPCWVDIPMNIQGSQVDEKDLTHFDLKKDGVSDSPANLDLLVKDVLERITSAKRPVIYAGTAIRSSGSAQQFLNLVEKLEIPVVSAWNAHDIIPNDHPFYYGRPGTVGDRAGNFIVQNSDLLLVLGCRLNIRQISYNYEYFAREAFKVIVDIDPMELQKPTVKPDLAICADVRLFMENMLQQLPSDFPGFTWWNKWCGERQRRYPVVLKKYWEKNSPVNPYCFVQELFDQLPEGSTVVTGDGTACVVTFQAAKIKKGQRLYTNSGCAQMGYDLPAAIGACFASGLQKVICLAGDGSLQLNIQELQTVVHYQLPIKLFYLNNQGYHSIRQTQENFFGKPYVGCGEESGLSFPDIGKIAGAYGISYSKCDSHSELSEVVLGALNGNKPHICEVVLDLDQAFSPKLSSRRLADGRLVSSPLEDLAPFLDRSEFLENMIIAPVSELE
jgi:acetolactate synthase-1/2/3 large subunit